jgi:hypothetical protein
MPLPSGQPLASSSATSGRARRDTTERLGDGTCLADHPDIGLDPEQVGDCRAARSRGRLSRNTPMVLPTVSDRPPHLGPSGRW